MTDLSTEETIRTAFAELQYDGPPHFAPPGVDAARRTVRRRRVGALATTASLAGVLVIGAALLPAGIDWASPAGGGTLPAATAPADPDDRPESTDPLIALAEGPLYARWPDAIREFETSEEIPSPGQAVLAGSGTLHNGVRSAVTSLRRGTYQLALTCVGESGTVAATAELAGHRYSATARCAMTADEIDAGVGEVAFVVEGEWEDILITYEADDVAMSGTRDPVTADMLILTE